MTALIGALAEAWAEVRHHRLRVLLSLIAIAVSVAAITAVVAVSDYAWQQNAEFSDRDGGRPATLSVSLQPETGATLDLADASARVDTVAARFGFSHVSRVARGFTAQIQTSDYLRPVQMQLVDPAYGEMHRVTLKEGRWFRDGDEELLAPPVILSEPLWDALGAQPVWTHPTITLGGDLAGTYQVVGVRPRMAQWDTEKTLTMLFDSYLARAGSLPSETSPSWEVWVGPDQASEIGPVLAADLRESIGDAATVGVSRTDWASNPASLEGRVLAELATVGAVSLVLLLGGLSLVNVQLVAMRQRIREIGVRRSFGATAGRIFTVVMLENVVATAVAGVIGILLVVVVLRTPLTTEVMFLGLQDAPPFPLRAALTGLAAAVGTGALAGILPALVAMRVRVIDALRF